MIFKNLELLGLVEVIAKTVSDDRGIFMELYKASEFNVHCIPGGGEVFRQDNMSISYRGVVRGLHYQLAPWAQGKLVRCQHGRVLDVVVDVRRGSPTLGRHLGVVLAPEKFNMLWVPPGFAHGFMALEDKSELVYKVTAEWSAEHERGLLYNDPALGIQWPELDCGLTVSPKDLALPTLANADLM